MTEFNYRELPLRELLDIEHHIDREAHAERWQELQAAIAHRREAGEDSFIDTRAGDAVMDPEDRFNTVWNRVFAYWVDGIIYLLLWIPSLPVLSSSLPVAAKVTVLMLCSLAGLLYRILLHGKYGQTLGKMATGVKVLRLDESPLGYGRAALRDIFYFLVLPFTLMDNYRMSVAGLPQPGAEADPLARWMTMVMIAWVIAGLVTMLLNSKRRAIHDYIAGSVVVRSS